MYFHGFRNAAAMSQPELGRLENLRIKLTQTLSRASDRFGLSLAKTHSIDITAVLRFRDFHSNALNTGALAD